MSTSTPLARPPYDVITVFDPDGEHPPFAYTIGVFDAFGLPELFAWGAPDAGVDPGERWVLSPSDLHRQLTDTVERLRVDATERLWEHGLDGGRTVLRTTLVPPGDDLPTYALSAGTPVRRLHLELIRPPIGTPARLAPAARAALVARTQRWADLLTGELGPVRTGLGQRYGPATAGVQLVLDLLAEADEGLLLCVASLEIAGGGGTMSAFAELDAIARTAGRGPWVARAQADADATLAALALRLAVDDRERLDAEAGVAFRCAVTAWVLADLLDEELFRRATASLRAAVTRCAGPEDEEVPPPERLAHAVRLAADLADDRVRPPQEDDLTVEGLRAIWLLAWTGRGRAVLHAAEAAGCPELLDDDRVWELLAAALVVDVAPEVVATLPPPHRAA
jgi:hypothetical protein